MMNFLDMTRPPLLAFGLCLMSTGTQAGEVVGRVVDAVDARAFETAVVRMHAAGQAGMTASTDRLGFFRLQGVAPGAYLIDVNLADGRSFNSRLVVLPARARQFIELDYSRAVPPDDDEDY